MHEECVVENVVWGTSEIVSRVLFGKPYYLLSSENLLTLYPEKLLKHFIEALEHLPMSLIEGRHTHAEAS